MYCLKKKLKYSASVAVISLVFILCLKLFPIGIVNAGNINAASDKINLIIDPGHGGADGGAVSITNTKESVLNLDISNKIGDILGLYGIVPTFTRNSEILDYPQSANTIHAKKVYDQKSRVGLINQTENAVVISIHQNNFSNSQPFGAETLYASTDGSQEFAEILQPLLVTNLNENNRRTASKISDSIFLMNNINCPAVLIECGFLSNPPEENLLKTKDYQLKISSVITSGYFLFEPKLKELYFGGTNES